MNLLNASRILPTECPSQGTGNSAICCHDADELIPHTCMVFIEMYPAFHLCASQIDQREKGGDACILLLDDLVDPLVRIQEHIKLVDNSVRYCQILKYLFT
jgi:hypothetical protein